MRFLFNTDALTTLTFEKLHYQLHHLYSYKKPLLKNIVKYWSFEYAIEQKIPYIRHRNDRRTYQGEEVKRGQVMGQRERERELRIIRLICNTISKFYGRNFSEVYFSYLRNLIFVWKTHSFFFPLVLHRYRVIQCQFGSTVCQVDN